MEAQAGARPPCIVFWVAPPLGDGERLIRNTLAACAAPPAHRIVLFTGALYRPQLHEVVLAMGQPMVAAMAAAGLVPKKRTIDSLRGRLHPAAAASVAASAATVPLSPSASSPRSRLRSPSLPPSPPPSSLSSSTPPSSPSLSSSTPPSSRSVSASPPSPSRHPSPRLSPPPILSLSPSRSSLAPLVSPPASPAAPCGDPGDLGGPGHPVNPDCPVNPGDAARARFLVTFHPSSRHLDPEKAEEIAWDIRLAERLARTGNLAPELGRYRWVDDFSDLIRSIEQKFLVTGRPVDVACDCETLGLHPYGGAPIVAYGFTDRAGAADCVYLRDIATEAHARRVLDQTRFLLTSPTIKLRGANFKYDMMWFAERLKIECTNFALDTLLAGSLLNENRSNSLGQHAKLYTALGGYDDAFNQRHDKTRMDLVPRDALLAYLGGDIDAVFQTADAIRRDLLDVPALANFYVTIRHPAALTFGRLERTGLLASRERFEALRVELEGTDGTGGLLADLDARALRLLPGRLRMKYADNLAIARPALLKDFFFGPLGLALKPRVVTPRTGEPSTSKTHLAMFHDVPEAREMVQLLAHRATAAKVLTTYVKGFLKHLRPDGRFHASYMLFVGTLFDDDDDVSGARTSRTSAKDPAVQTIPKHWKDKTGPNWPKKLRQCFVAPPGHVLWSTDAAQGELKIAACLADEPTMLQAYRAGLDLHALTGAAMLDMQYEAFLDLARADPEQFELGRFKAKAANFGMLYLVSARGFARYAWDNYRMVLSVAEAQAMIDKFFARYPGLLAWHERTKQAARRDGYVVSPLGVVRHLPLIKSRDAALASRAERQAVNSPVQSTLSNLTEWALVEIEKHIPEAPLCAMIHDAGMGYCPEDRAEELGKRIVEVASSLPIEQKFGWKPQLELTFDFEHGPDMGSMTKMKRVG